MPQCVVVCKQECNLSADIIVSPSTGTWGCVPTDAAPQRCMTRKFPMFFYACGIENPTDFPLHAGGLPVGFFVLKEMPTNHFPFVGTPFKTHLGIQRDGNSFGSYVSNRGGERPVGRGKESTVEIGNEKGHSVPFPG